jgi:hypothetical protein
MHRDFVSIVTVFWFIAARSEAVRATLGLYSGPSSPDLLISQRSLANDPVDGALAGIFNPSFDVTTDSPPFSGNFERLAGRGEAEIRAGLDDGSLLTGARLKSAELVLDSQLSISIPFGRPSGASRQAISTALHELGHADSAARDPLGHLRLSLVPNQMQGKRLPHDLRRIEINAETYRKANEKLFF